MDDVGDARVMQGSHFRTEFGAGDHRDVRIGALDLHVGGQGRGRVRECKGNQPRGTDARQVHGDLVLDVSQKGQMAAVEQGFDGVRIQVDNDAGDAVLGQAFMKPPAYGAVAANDGMVPDAFHACDQGFHVEAFPFCFQPGNAHQQRGEFPCRLHQQRSHAHGDGGNGVNVGGHQRRDGGYFLHERDEHQGKFPHIGECGGGHDAHAPGNFQEACGCKAGYEFDREDKGGEGRHLADVFP